MNASNSYHNTLIQSNNASTNLVCAESNLTAVVPSLLLSPPLSLSSSTTTMMPSNSITQFLPLLTVFQMVLGTKLRGGPFRSLQDSPEILHLELWDTMNQAKLTDLINDTQVVILDELVNEMALTVVASTADENSVESVRFGLDGDNDFRTENRAPYTLCGDNIEEYDACGNRLGLGSHTMTATPYSENGANGQEGTTLSIQFEVTKVAPVHPVLGFQLIYTDNGSVIANIQDGDAIDVGTINDQFSVVAETTDAVKSMLFLETGQVENVVAYSMCGNVGNDYNTCRSLRAGSNATVTVRAYPQNHLQGSPYPDLAISFSLATSDTVLVLCGQFANNVNGTCVCQNGYMGDPIAGCTVDESMVIPGLPDCGENAVVGDSGCECLEGFTGDPLEGCVMELPIVETCGDNAQLVNDACVCNPGFEGDPSAGCTDVCNNPSTCGGSTRGVSCSNTNGEISCSCMLNFKGNPPESPCVSACNGPFNPCGPGIACQDVDAGVLCYPTGCSDCRDNETCRPGSSEFRQGCLCASEENPPTEFDGQFDCITIQT